ncbi:MAG TPA: hypothetical protein VGB63_04900, partial [Pedobacter sp.]
IEYAGLRKVYTKGISLANKCMLLAGMAYNLKKLIRKMEITTTPPNLNKLIDTLVHINKLIDTLFQELEVVMLIQVRKITYSLEYYFKLSKSCATATCSSDLLNKPRERLWKRERLFEYSNVHYSTSGRLP